jgi:hypothetical protein
MVEKLIERHLWNAGLVRLTPHLVERYNTCLSAMGLRPTALPEIDVDGMGVSPQIAKDRGNPYYLCNGLSNPLAIIVSPDQYDKPAYYPIFSWQRSLMRTVFDKNPKSIRDITGTHAIAIAIEDGLSRFEGPEDLLLLTEITAVPHIEELAEAKNEQARLIAEFSDDLNCLREDLCEAIVLSRNAHGDLRKRKLDMRPITFNSFGDFHTVAFGGAAVLRHVDGEDVLVLENEETLKNVNKRKLRSANVFYLYDLEFALFDKLKKSKWVDVPVKRYRKDPKLLEFKRELLLADALCDCDDQVNWRTLTNPARMALMLKHEDKVPAIYSELERFAAALKANRVLNLTRELEHFLAEPSEKMSSETQQVLWILLTRREPRNLLALYTVDKNAFLARYDTWSERKQAWAADYLVIRYKHHHRVNQ